MYDVIIVGGGAAGLSAALVLGRARRRVLVVDAGEPRNAPSTAAHGVFTRDGTPPSELLRIGREQLRPYGSVEYRLGEVTQAHDTGNGFAVGLAADGEERARKLLLATGVRDELPAIPGFRDLWGQGVYHCPYCHGWEARDLPLAVYANGAVAGHLAPLVRNWSADVVLLTDGPAELADEDRARLAALDIPVREERVARLEGKRGRLDRVRFASGEALPRHGLFVRPAIRPNNALAEQLGCALTDGDPIPGLIEVDAGNQTSIPGVYAAGDVTTPMQQVIVAAAAGATTAAWINHALVAATAPAMAATPPPVAPASAA